MKNDPRSYDRNFYNCVKKPERLFQGFQASLPMAIVKIAIITARIILHLISYPQFTYDFFHMHHSLTYSLSIFFLVLIYETIYDHLVLLFFFDFINLFCFCNTVIFMVKQKLVRCCCWKHLVSFIVPFCVQ